MLHIRLDGAYFSGSFPRKISPTPKIGRILFFENFEKVMNEKSESLGNPWKENGLNVVYILQGVPWYNTLLNCSKLN